MWAGHPHPNVVESKEHSVFVLLEVYRSGYLYAHSAPMSTSTHRQQSIRKCIEVVITARTRNAVTGLLVRGFESHRFRQRQNPTKQ